MARFKADVLAYEAPQGLLVGGTGCCLAYRDADGGADAGRRLTSDGECCLCVASAGDTTAVGTAEGAVVGFLGGGVEAVECVREQLGDAAVSSVFVAPDMTGVLTVVAADVQGTVARYAPWGDGAIWKRPMRTPLADMKPVHLHTAEAAGARSEAADQVVTTHVTRCGRYVVAVTAHATTSRPAADAGGAVHVLSWTGKHFGSFRLPVEMTPSTAVGIDGGLVLATYREPYGVYHVDIDAVGKAAVRVSARLITPFSTPVLRILPLPPTSEGRCRVALSSGSAVATLAWGSGAAEPVVAPLLTPDTYIDDVCLRPPATVVAVDAAGTVMQLPVDGP